MTRLALLTLAGACLLAGLPAAAAQDPDLATENIIKVQTAMLRARDLLNRQRDPGRAVEELEKHLGIINGNPTYLQLLADAYRAYLTQPGSAAQRPLAEKYRRRLEYLDGTAATDPTLNAAAQAPKTAPLPAVPTTVGIAAQSAQPSPTASPKVADNGIVARGASPGPFDLANQMSPPLQTAADSARLQALRLLARAEAEFTDKHYAQAKLLFEQAHQVDPQCTAQSRERWAYCKLSGVTEALNQQAQGQPCAWEALEKEVRAAHQMAPQLNGICSDLLDKIGKRRGGAGASPAAVAVQHTGAGAQGWLLAETKNFRVFHKQTPEVAEKVARVAEATRGDTARKWFGGAGEDWAPKCDIYLHNSAAEYVELSKVAAGTPGHSRIECDRTTFKVVSRRIDLHCEGLNWLTTVLPHETTHAVIAGRFGSPQVPRWADEGMAVLAEPADVQEKHRANLLKCLKQGGGSFPVSDLMQMPNYPTAERVGAFYAQSVSLVDFLSRQRGPQVFSQFLRDAAQQGYQKALATHYGIADFAELQNRWVQHVQASLQPAAYAQQAGGQ
jgi:hypothetical protein